MTLPSLGTRAEGAELGRVLVTGCAGFIGSHLSDRLLGLGAEVIGIDNFDSFYPRKVKEGNLRTSLADKLFHFVELDVRNGDALTEIASGCDCIVHLAAKAGVRPSFDDADIYHSINVVGTRSVIEAAKVAKVPKFVFASSSSVYGDGPIPPFTESAELGVPLSPYSESKQLAEREVMGESHFFDSVAILRFFTVYGARQRPDLAIHKFARLISSHQPIPLYGDQSSFRDYTYIDDILDGLIAALRWNESVSVFNLGSGRPIGLMAMVKELEQALGMVAEVERRPSARGDMHGTWANVDRASRLLGYFPKVSFEKGLVKFANWFHQQQGL